MNIEDSTTLLFKCPNPYKIKIEYNGELPYIDFVGKVLDLIIL